jgi:hypothetical protein
MALKDLKNIFGGIMKKSWIMFKLLGSERSPAELRGLYEFFIDKPCPGRASHIHKS